LSDKPNARDEEGFLGRWSRRKLDGGDIEGNEETAGAADEAAQPPVTGPATAADAEPAVISPGRMITRQAGSEPGGEGGEAGAEKPVLTDADMPALDTLDEHSDFSGFLSPGVSDSLRKLALRKLFSSAGFNIRDGLDDYDEDFTSFTPLGDIVTSDMKHRAEVAEERRRAAAAAQAEEGAAEAISDDAPQGDESGKPEAITDPSQRAEEGEQVEADAMEKISDCGSVAETGGDEDATGNAGAKPRKPSGARNAN
jgi:hypothetical protein